MSDAATGFKDETYQEKLDLFLSDIVGVDCETVRNMPEAGSTVAKVFHAVRNMTYASTGNRSPETVMDARKGACTGKHILLRDLLRRAGFEADVRIVAGDFAAAVPVAPGMSDSLKQWAGKGGIRDFHNFVVWKTADGGESILDATWPDSLAWAGFAVNSNWNGTGQTRLALEPTGDPQEAEDIVSLKEKMLSGLTRKQVADRRRFLELLTDWIDGNQTRIVA